MISPPPAPQYGDSSGLKRWLIGCFVIVPLLCCGGAVLFSRRWVDSFDYSADLDHQVTEAKKHNLPMESKDLLGLKVADADNSYPTLKKLMHDYPNMSKISEPLTGFLPKRGGHLPAVVVPFVSRARDVAKYRGFDAHKDYDLGRNLLFSEYAPLKQVARSLGAQAIQEAANGNVDGCIADLRLARNIGIQLSHEKVLIGALVDFSAEQIYIRAAERSVEWFDSNPSALQKLKSFVAESYPVADFQLVFQGEFFYGVTFARNYELFGGSKAMSDDNFYEEIDPKKLKRSGLPNGAIARGMLASYIKHMLNIQKIFESEKNLSVAAKKVDQYQDAIPPSVSNSMIIATTPIWGGAGNAWERQKLNKVMLVKLIDLIQHRSGGRFPGEIDDIPDPVGGGTVMYKRTADGFTIYSLGANQKDDGGLGNKTDRSKSDDFGFEYPSVQKN